MPSHKVRLSNWQPIRLLHNHHSPTLLLLLWQLRQHGRRGPSELPALYSMGRERGFTVCMAVAVGRIIQWQQVGSCTAQVEAKGDRLCTAEILRSSCSMWLLWHSICGLYSEWSRATAAAVCGPWPL